MDVESNLFTLLSPHLPLRPSSLLVHICTTFLMSDIPSLPYRTFGNYRLVPKQPRAVFGIGPGRRAHTALPESPTLSPGQPVVPEDSPAEIALRGILRRSEVQLLHTQDSNMPNPPQPDLDPNPPEPLPVRPSSATLHSSRSTTVVSPHPTGSRPQARASSSSSATLTHSPDRSSPTRVGNDQQLPSHNSTVTVVSTSIAIPKERHDPHSTVGRMARLREYLNSTPKTASPIHPPPIPNVHVSDFPPVEAPVSESLVSRSGPLVELGTRGGPPPVMSNCRIPRRFAYEIDGPTLPSMINQVMMLLDAVVPVWGSREVNFVIYQTVSSSMQHCMVDYR